MIEVLSYYFNSLVEAKTASENVCEKVFHRHFAHAGFSLQQVCTTKTVCSVEEDKLSCSLSFSTMIVIDSKYYHFSTAATILYKLYSSHPIPGSLQLVRTHWWSIKFFQLISVCFKAELVSSLSITDCGSASL